MAQASTTVKNGWLREKLNAIPPWAFFALFLIFGVPQTIQFLTTGIVPLGTSAEIKKSKDQSRELAELKIKIDNLISATSKLTEVAQQTTLATALNSERIQQVTRQIQEIKLQLRR